MVQFSLFKCTLDKGLIFPLATIAHYKVA